MLTTTPVHQAKVAGFITGANTGALTGTGHCGTVPGEDTFISSVKDQGVVGSSGRAGSLDRQLLWWSRLN
jgi:hypothetical protein